MQKIKKWVIVLLLLLPILLFVGMRAAWWLVPKKPLVVLAIDKSLLIRDKQKERPLFWILKHDRYVRKNGLLYDSQKDYLGLFPLEDNQYALRDFQNMSDNDVQYIAANVDVAYYMGMSGVTTDINKSLKFPQGGLTKMDMSFLKQMKKSRKLIFAEFNVMSSPTKSSTRHEFENEFGIRWTGWIGRYFALLDSTNSELPRWLIQEYMKQHEGKWPFASSGIVFAHENGTIEILDSKTDLCNSEPLIHTFSYGIYQLGMAAKLPYENWFDIVQMTDSTNHAISVYELVTNSKGRALLSKREIPVVFPAVIMHKKQGFEFYYFCGNYSDNKITSNSSYFIGGQHLALMLDATSSNQFFYNFYRPMLSSILNQHYKSLQKKQSSL